MLIDVWSPVYGGGVTHAWVLAKKLVENHGCAVDIYTRKLEGVSGRVYDRNESFLEGELNVYRIGYPTDQGSIIGRIAYTLLTPFQLRRRYDIIHAHTYYGAYPAKIIKLIKKKPTILTVHGIALSAREEMDSGALSKIKSFFEKITIFNVKYDCEISVDSTILKYKNTNTNIKIIPNGVDVSPFDSVDVSTSGQLIKILYVGRLHPQKGLKYLIAAAKKVIHKYPCRFHIVGSGDLEEDLKAQINRAGLSKYFIFHGELCGVDLITQYKSAHLFVLPSIYEGQPLTLLEAWAAKLPVVVTDVGGNGEIIREGVNGYLVEPKNPEKLSEAIIKALENERLKGVGEAGYNLVKKEYGWDKLAERVYRIYEEVNHESI
ncbi:MAG: hypothetical protein DRQ88_11570 [Epsilonproteobacteria bacterium]|nr:MAG: hypothetical protein DRQ88_11570 [Campylobacterota bacterium]